MSPVGDGRGEEDLCHVCSGGHSLTYVLSGGWWRRAGALECTQWGMLSDTSPVGDGRGGSVPCMQWGTLTHMFPVGDGGGGSLACTQWGTLSDTCPQWGMVEEDLSHVRSGGRSVTHVPSGGWWRRGGSVPCKQRGTHSDTCPQWGMGEERRICAMYAVGDTHSHMFPVGDGAGEEELQNVHSGGHSVKHVPSGGWGRRGGSQPCTQWGTLSDTCPQWGVVEERRISAMYAVGDAQ